ncbi:MAG: fumarylacetoacetate hydrolase family protein [Rhodoferax sp.]|nr:fumarylacetoacetate hydrolase family protein [Rhodoferax sp.]
MKLASYKDGSRDGQLVVVSRDLSQAHYASHVANRLQQALDDWNFLSPQLQDIFDALNAGRARHAFPFDPAQCMAPLPRAHQLISSEAYPSHTALLRKAAGLPEVPERAAGPEMAQCASDALLGAHDPLLCATEALGLDFGAGLAVVTGDIPQDCAADRALDGVRLLMLCNQARLRHLVPAGGAPGAAALQSWAGTAFGPVAVTPDELGEAWARGRVNLALQTGWNGRKVGLCEAGTDMEYPFGQLLALAAKTRPLRAGSIVCAGPLSNAGVEKKGQWSWPHGYHSIAENRAMEVLQDGQASTEFLRYGDTLRIEMKTAAGSSLFGAIEQEVVPLNS